ncbi:MAG: hypothetical protein ACRER5_16315 [Pseudomonas sp.]
MTSETDTSTQMVRSDNRAAETSHGTRMDAPAPGTYWRVREDIKGQHDHRRQTNSLTAGTVLLLSKVEVADGEPLVYVFAPHPSLHENLQIESRIHADDFYACFEPAPDGDEVRRGELDLLLAAMEATKAKMMAPPPESAPLALLSHDPSEQVGIPGQALVSIDQVDAMIVHAERLKEDAERRSSWITKHSKTLGAQALSMANFHKERAEASIARANDQLEGVKSLLRTAENLQYYTGQGVELLLLRDGKGADPDEPITVYQDVLSFDEETLILLDQGGADHTRVEAIVDALTDPTLLERMIPAKRGITLVRFRASAKEFVSLRDESDIASMAYNAAMSAESSRLRLLVRDGDWLSMVDVPDVLKNIKQLLPSQGEQDSYFLEEPSWFERDKGPRRITRDDLAFAGRRRKQVGALDSYGQVLIALWGMFDRGDIFPNGPMHKFTNWLDPSVQSRFFRLVSLDSMLEETRPNFAEWRDEHNQYLSPGCTVAVRVNQLCDEKHLPAAYSHGSYPRMIYEVDPEEAWSKGIIGRVQTDDTGLFVIVSLRHSGYSREIKRTHINGKLYIQFHGCKARLDDVLVIDRIHAEDLNYYLWSRRQRASYERYVRLFQMARTAVQERDAMEAPLREQLVGAVHDGNVSHDPDQLEKQITNAIAVARTARRRQDIPAPGSAAFKAFLKNALDALHAATTGDAVRIEAIERWASNNQRQALRLVFNGKGRYRLYFVPTEREHESRLGSLVHACVTPVEFQPDGTVVIGEMSRELLRARASELVIKDWNWTTALDSDKPANDYLGNLKPPEAGAARWLCLSAPYRASYGDAVRALDMGIEQSAWFKMGFDPEELARLAESYSRRESKGSVVRMQLTFAIGSGLVKPKDAPRVLVATIDAWKYAYHLGDEQTKSSVREAIKNRYRHPDTHVKSLDSELKWSAASVTIDAAIKMSGDRAMSGAGGFLGFDEDDIKPSKYNSNFVEVTSITQAGAELFPWMLAVAQRPLEP